MPGGGGGPEGSRAEWGMGLWKPSFRASCSSRVQLTRLVLTEAHSSISGLPTNRRVLKTSLERPELADSAFSQPPQKFTQEALIFHTPLLAGRLNRKPAKQGWTATATQIEMDVHILSHILVYVYLVQTAAGPNWGNRFSHTENEQNDPAEDVNRPESWFGPTACYVSQQVHFSERD